MKEDSNHMESLQHGFCVYADLLGIKSAIKEASAKGSSDALIKKLLTAVADAKQQFVGDNGAPYGLPPRIYWRIFSDNLAIVVPTTYSIDNGIYELSSATLNAMQWQLAMTIKGFPLRGAISLGEIFLGEDLVIGQALVEAFELEEKDDFPRITFTANVMWKIRQHLKEKPNRRQSPVNNYLLIDEDGKAFINYLDVMECLGRYSVEHLMLHKSVAEKGLHCTDERVLMKYRWMAAYHNYFCSTLLSEEQKSDELLISEAGGLRHFTRAADYLLIA